MLSTAHRSKRAHPMSKQFWLFLLAGLAVVAGLLFLLLAGTKGAHLRLEGKILKVRVLSLPGSKAVLVTSDFRVTNPSDVPFVVSSVKIRLQPAEGDAVEGATISKPDMATVFEYLKLLGPQYNPVLSIQDRINPHQQLDRMAGARFDLPEASIQARRNLTLTIEEIDGTIAELTETK
jgi:hypothetical protein